MSEFVDETRGDLPIAGGQLHYALTESAGSDIVLLHGFSFDLRSWDPQLPPLARQHRVLRYDLRGFGLSDLPRHPYSHADDLAELIARLGLKRPLIVGLSLGANIAMSYALDHPEGLSGLVLASPGLPGHAWTTDRPPDAAREFARCNDLAATKSFWLGHPMFASLGDHPPAEQLAARMVDDYSGWHWYNSDMQSPSEPLSERFTNIHSPTLVLSGGRDDPGYREIADRIAANLHDARMVRFPEAGHILNLEVPEAFNAAVLDFAASLSAPIATEERQEGRTR